MCNGCDWKIEPNPEANENRIQPGVPFWIETGTPCQECVEREFALLYASCGYGRCKRQRVGPQGGCEIHAEFFSTPEDYTRPERPENAEQGGRITPYHRSTRRKKQDETPKPKPKDEAEQWKGYSDSIDEALGRPKGPDGKWLKETKEEKAYREAQAIKRMAHNIEHAWD